MRSSVTLQRLRYAPAPVDNPLKGLVPYSGDVRDRFPHSMEFNYIPLSVLVVGKDRYNWTVLENLLNEVAGRGHQTIFRVFLEYPGHKNVIPKFLIDGGLKVFRYSNTNTQPLPPTEVETPDYNDPALRTTLKAFIATLGSRYDADPRIGFITAGLLGTWGEWHDSPHDELFASKAVQTEVMDAYEQAFKRTPILLRYPAGVSDSSRAANDRRRFGYHDDSFAWATLDTGKASDSWFYMALLKSAGTSALEKWKRCPIGGEIRPEAWGKVFDASPGGPQIQDFSKCVEQTHVSWLMDSGMFESGQSTERKKRATDAVRRMGYEFFVSSVTVTTAANRLRMQLEVFNRGVAPFYYDWPVEYALCDANRKIVRTFAGQGKLTDLLPGTKPKIWNEVLNVQGIAPGHYALLLRVVNPLKNGKPLRFANAEQDSHESGWLTLIPNGHCIIY